MTNKSSIWTIISTSAAVISVLISILFYFVKVEKEKTRLETEFELLKKQSEKFQDFYYELQFYIASHDEKTDAIPANIEQTSESGPNIAGVSGNVNMNSDSKKNITNKWLLNYKNQDKIPVEVISNEKDSITLKMPVGIQKFPRRNFILDTTNKNIIVRP